MLPDDEAPGDAILRARGALNRCQRSPATLGQRHGLWLSPTCHESQSAYALETSASAIAAQVSCSTWLAASEAGVGASLCFIRVRRILLSSGHPPSRGDDG